MAAPAPSAAPGSPQPPARPLPATCAGRGITARFPAACGHTGRALPSLLRGEGRGPGRAGPDPHLPRYLRAGAREGGRWGKFVSVVGCAARRGRSGRAGGSERSQGSGRRAAAGPRAEGGEPSRAESSQAESSVCGGRHPPREGRGTRRHGAARGEGALPAPAPPAAASR